MAVNVLVIPEDFRKDQYVLKPIIEKMFEAMEVRARVQVCRDPLMGGVGEAMKWERLLEVIERYRGMTQLFLLIVDRDCDPRRRERLDTLEACAARELAGGRSSFLATEAMQEVEVWVLAGLRDLPAEWRWKDIRAHCDPKEAFYDEMAKRRGLRNAPYEGRESLAREAAANFERIRQLCTEDVGSLSKRARTALDATR